MALSISNLVTKYAPQVGAAVGGLVSPSLAPALAGLASFGKQAPKAPATPTAPAAPAQAVPAPAPQATYSAPAYTPPSQPVKGLLPASSAALSPSLSFGGLVGGLADTQNSPYNQAAQKYIGKTADYGAGNIDLGKQARDIAEQFGQKYADIGEKGAKFRAGQLTTGTTPVAEGNAAVTAQTTAAQQQALAQGQQAALQGIGYQLTGQQQAANAANQAAGQALTGQGQQQAALGTAAGLAQPQLGSIGQVPFNPLDQNQGQILGTTQGGGVAAAGNLLGQFSGAQAAGAAPGNALAAVVGTQTQQQAAYQSAHQQAQNLQAQLTDLITTLGLNPSDINAVNAGIQKIAQNTSSPEYKILSNYIADIASRYSQVLTPPGGSATDTTRSVASGMLDGIASGQSIISVMNSLDQQARAVIAGVPTTGGAQTPQQPTGAVVQTSAGPVNTSW